MKPFIFQTPEQGLRWKEARKEEGKRKSTRTVGNAVTSPWGSIWKKEPVFRLSPDLVVAEIFSLTVVCSYLHSYD